jgi:hypothetical protein
LAFGAAKWIGVPHSLWASQSTKSFTGWVKYVDLFIKVSDTVTVAQIIDAWHFAVNICLAGG